ncbi:pyoverdine biosynthesis protein PvdN [Pilimelia anulata]|uniref:Pyoverdine biosynthesis protein PvdN n=1 Tax=Pilimelia anulata TaxID=53371 RepID=A0A8J3B1E8_9ACTN|nr:aminotransferase class V-fold PLP-dependent enzyme [Pilimelia anulata]GGJ87596.1 pyoverdine biosynthesis protein PvdN [Pilimelia anulata]
MPHDGLHRRGFLTGMGALTGTALVSPALLGSHPTTHSPTTTPVAAHSDLDRIDPGPQVVDPGTGAVDWAAVRSQFRLAPNKVHFSLFLLSSNPTPIRERMAQVSAQFDADPMRAYDGDGNAASAVARYLGAQGGETALCWNTTTAHGLVWGSLKIKADQEILVSGYDHFVQHGSIDLLCRRTGAKKRTVSLFAEPGKATADEIAGKLKAAITPKTRAVGTTWGMSSCGVRMPLKVMAQVIAEANKGRAEPDRCLLIVDGVHALGAVDDDPAASGVDVFLAGLHKWLFGPRGTGVVWYKASAVQHFWPQHHSYGGGDLNPGGFHAYEARWALPTTIAWHDNIGRKNIAGRIAELSTRLKDGLAGIRGMQLRTPRDPAMSAGINCFEISGVSNQTIVSRLQSQGLLASHATYSVPYARIGTACINTPEEIDKAIAAVRQIAGGR